MIFHFLASKFAIERNKQITSDGSRSICIDEIPDTEKNVTAYCNFRVGGGDGSGELTQTV